jgi:hypothetical protein
MKKIIFAAILVSTAIACKKTTSTIRVPVKYYFRVEAVDNDGSSSITPYKTIVVH